MIKKVKKFIKKMTSYLPGKRVKKLEEELKKQKNDIYIVERDLFAAYKNLEYKVNEFNNCANQILYELELRNRKKKKNFNPLVSIIIPVYNGSNYLSCAIEAALFQTYQNIEVIVVNDGSNDNGSSRKVADKYKKQISYYEKENGGVSSALNYGIKKMKGDYFVWLSHDDLISKDHVMNLVNYLSYEGTEYDIPYANFKIIDEHGYTKVNDSVIYQLNLYDYKVSKLKNEYTLLQGEINGGSVMIPKVAFDEFGLFDEKQRITQERDMWARLIAKYHFISIPYTTSMIRSHEHQVTKINPDIKRETDKKNLEIIKNLDNSIKCKLEGDVVSFYRIMSNFYKNNNNKDMENAMHLLEEKILSSKEE